MSTEVTIRPGAEPDARAVALLLTELGYAVDAEQAAARLERGLETVLVAECDGRLVGLLSTWAHQSISRSRPVARVAALIVAEDFRGRGIGSALMGRAVHWAIAAGCEGIELTSGLRPEREMAHRFYEQLGFVRTSYRFWFPLPTDSSAGREMTA